MKYNYIFGLMILSLLISQQLFSQKESTKNPLRGEQQIELSEGYSFVSSRIMAANPDFENILQYNLANLDFARNSQGFMLQKIGPVWVNNIGDWINTEGYMIKMTSDDVLNISGDIIDPQTPVNLSVGYQIIGYLPDEPLNTEEIFQDVLENLEFVRNSAGFMFQKIGPVWVNNIGDMQPSEGYLVKMNSDDNLIYPGSLPFSCGDAFTDSRDGKSYETVQIGNQCWMAENLNIGTMINGNQSMSNDGIIEKYCQYNDTSNCATYGGLYQWNEMMEYTSTESSQGICPSGWHVPSDDEWKILEGTVDSQYPVGDPIWNTTNFRGFDVGKNLRSTTGWYQNSGTDLYGFNALPGGARYSGYFNYLNYETYIWTSSEYDSGSAWDRGLKYFGGKVSRDAWPKTYGFSVRCVKD